MSGYALTPLAKADIFDIWSYIAERRFMTLARLSPKSLRAAIPDLTTRLLRFWTLTRDPNYTVVFRPETALYRLSASSTEKETYGTS